MDLDTRAAIENFTEFQAVAVHVWHYSRLAVPQGGDGGRQVLLALLQLVLLAVDLAQVERVLRLRHAVL